MENSTIPAAHNEATYKRKSDAMADNIIDLTFDSNSNALLDNQEKKKKNKKCKTTTDNSRRRPKTIVPKDNMKQWRLPAQAAAPAPAHAPVPAPAMTPAPIALDRHIVHRVITTPLFLEADIQCALPYFNDEASTFLQHERNRMYDISKTYPHQSLTQECMVIDSIFKARVNYPTDSSDRIQIMFEKSFENQGIIKQPNSVERQSYWNCLLDWSINVLPVGQRIYNLPFGAAAARRQLPAQVPVQVPTYQLPPQYPPLSNGMYNNVSYNSNYQTNSPGPYQGPSNYGHGMSSNNFNNGNSQPINPSHYQGPMDNRLFNNNPYNGNTQAIDITRFRGPSIYGRMPNTNFNNQPINIAGPSTYGYEMSNNNFNNGKNQATNTAQAQRPIVRVSNDTSNYDISQKISPTQFEQTSVNVEEQFEQSAPLQGPTDEMSSNDSNNNISLIIDLTGLEEAPVNVGEPFEQPHPFELDTEVPEGLEALSDNKKEEFDYKKLDILEKWNREHVKGVNGKVVYIGEGKDLA